MSLYIEGTVIGPREPVDSTAGPLSPSQQPVTTLPPDNRCTDRAMDAGGAVGPTGVTPAQHREGSAVASGLPKVTARQ